MTDGQDPSLGLVQEAANAIWDQRYATNTGLPGSTPNQGDPIDYTQHPFLYVHSILLPVTGRPDTTLRADIGRRHLTPPPERVLSIGAGTAHNEEALVREGFAQTIVVYEMSQAAITSAAERIAGQEYANRIDLRCADILTEDLPDATFDAVYIQAAIHHFVKIEEMYQLIHRVLKPGGLLIFDEYIGPDHHQFPPDLMEIMDALNACLDTRYRHDHLTGQLRNQLPRPSLEWMLQHDPSEGVHASRILPLTYQYFDVIERIGTGGTIMRPFFCGILRNFDFSDPKDQTIARLIINTEQQLIKSGIIPHYHMAVVAKRRDVPRAPLTEAQCARIAYEDWNPAILDAFAAP